VLRRPSRIPECSYDTAEAATARVSVQESNEPYLAAKESSVVDVDKMHGAWCKSMQLQIALWAKPYMDGRLALNQW